MTGYLLDTHVLLWASTASDRLSPRAREIFLNPEAQLVFSAASLWEITIKIGLERSDFRHDPVRLRAGLIEHGYEELAIQSEHALATAALPAIHRDPFDRILLAQARHEGLLLMTADRTLQEYGSGIEAV